MGVLPLQFKEGTTAATLRLGGSETYDVLGLGGSLKPQQDLILRVTRGTGEVLDVPVRCRIDTPIRDRTDYRTAGSALRAAAKLSHIRDSRSGQARLSRRAYSDPVVIRLEAGQLPEQAPCRAIFVTRFKSGREVRHDFLPR